MLTPMQTGLLTTAASAFDWIFTHLDGGLLNDLFTLNSNNTVELNKFTLDLIFKLLQNDLFGGGRKNLRIVKWIPESLGGGPDVQAETKVVIFTGIVILIGIILLLIPIAVAIMSCACRCRCCRKQGRTPQPPPVLNGSVSDTLSIQLEKFAFIC